MTSMLVGYPVLHRAKPDESLDSRAPRSVGRFTFSLDLSLFAHHGESRVQVVCQTALARGCSGDPYGRGFAAVDGDPVIVDADEFNFARVICRDPPVDFGPFRLTRDGVEVEVHTSTVIELSRWLSTQASGDASRSAT